MEAIISTAHVVVALAWICAISHAILPQASPRTFVHADMQHCSVPIDFPGKATWISMQNSMHQTSQICDVHWRNSFHCTYLMVFQCNVASEAPAAILWQDLSHWCRSLQVREGEKAAEVLIRAKWNWVCQTEIKEKFHCSSLLLFCYSCCVAHSCFSLEQTYCSNCMCMMYSTMMLQLKRRNFECPDPSTNVWTRYRRIQYFEFFHEEAIAIIMQGSFKKRVLLLEYQMKKQGRKQIREVDTAWNSDPGSCLYFMK